MNGRKMYREYAQWRGKEAREFVRIEPEMYQFDTLITKSNSGAEERTTLNYKDVVEFIIKKY